MIGKSLQCIAIPSNIAAAILLPACTKSSLHCFLEPPRMICQANFPCNKHLSTHKICTATSASPLPLVLIVMVKGLKSQLRTPRLILSTGVPTRVKMSLISLTDALYDYSLMAIAIQGRSLRTMPPIYPLPRRELCPT